MHSSFVGMHREKAEKAVYLTQKRNDIAQKFDGSRTIGSYLNSICIRTVIILFQHSNYLNSLLRLDPNRPIAPFQDI